MPVKRWLLPLLLLLFVIGGGAGYLALKKEAAAPVQPTAVPTSTAAQTGLAQTPSPADEPTVSPSPVPSPTAAEEDPLVQRVKAMTLEEKIGQMVLAGVDGTAIDGQMRSLLATYHVGGLILYKPNITSAAQTVALLNNLKAANAGNPAPLFLSLDEEGGRVSRLPGEYTKLPAARAIGTVDDSAFSFGIGELLARQVSSLGFNLDFAPVLDVDSNPDNPVIGDRSFSRDASVVAKLGIQTMKGLQAGKVVPVVKHFPGHGDTSVDSHIGLPVVNHDLQRLRSLELVPFAEAVKEGADMVMVAHILLPKLDADYPSSLSRPVITDLLRGELGYGGVVITDDLTMGAVTEHYQLANAAVLSIKAGSDILLVGHGFDSAVSVIEAVKKAVGNGELTEARLDQSVLRILALKEKYSLQDSRTPVPDPKAINSETAKLLNTYMKQ